MNKNVDLEQCKVLVDKKDYERAIQFYESKGYWISCDFLNMANEFNITFFLLGIVAGRVFLCGDKNCNSCNRVERGYFPKCKTLKIVPFNDREEKLKRILYPK